jgi:2-succinyl-6-hydroxy-2,4-cyclohexadiene-1-carboxylate synthase
VLLHGFLGAPSAWDAVLAALPRHGPVWCPWLPGHGPWRAALPTSWDEAVRLFAASLPEGAVLAGYSLGARLALAAALGRPARTRATLLVGGHVGPVDDAERAERAALDAQRAADLRQRDLAAFVAAWEALPLFATQRALPPELQARQRAVRLAHDGQALTWAFEVAGLAQMPDLRAAVAAARQPLHFLTGALDTRFAALAATLARPPWVTQASVPAAGHNLLLEAPSAVAASLNDLMEM